MTRTIPFGQSRQYIQNVRFSARLLSDNPKYLNEGRAIGEAIGKAGKTMVYGGTDFGLMKAVADAAHETGRPPGRCGAETP